jgi:hypothetical protein
MLVLRDDLWLRKFMSTSPSPSLSVVLMTDLHVHAFPSLALRRNLSSRRLCAIALLVVAQRGHGNGVTADHYYRTQPNAYDMMVPASIFAKVPPVQHRVKDIRGKYK